MKKQLLTDTMTIRLNVVESSDSGKLIARGEFARANVATANRRIYPESLWKKNLNRLRKDLSERKVLGELDHPADGKTMLQRVSHVITNITIDDNGVVVGEAEVLPGTDKGKQLKALIDAGIAVGVSSRGYGSVQENADGVDVVQDDYHLMTFDFVADPANVSSFPSFSTESSAVSGNLKEQDQAGALPSGGQVVEPAQVEEPKPEDASAEPKEISDEQWCKQSSKTSPQGVSVHPAVVNGRQVWVTLPEDEPKAESRLSPEEMQAQIAIAVQEATERARQDFVAELTADPSSVSARSALESVKAILRPYVLDEDVTSELATRDAKIQSLESQIKDVAKLLTNKEAECEALTNACKDMGYSLYLQKNLSLHPRFESIVSGLGRLTDIPTLERLKSLVAVHVEEARTLRQQSVEEQKTRVVQLENKVATLTRELTKTSDERDRVLKSSVEANARVVMERRIVGHPHADQIRKAWEAVKATSVTEITALVESFSRNPKSGSLMESVQATLKRRSLPSPQMVEESLKGTTVKDASRHRTVSIPGMPINDDEFEALAGLKG